MSEKTRDDMLREMQENIVKNQGNQYFTEVAMPGVKADTVNPADIDH